MERYLRVNLLGPGPRLVKKNLPGRGLTKVEKHRCRCISEAVVLSTFRNTGGVALPTAWYKVVRRDSKLREITNRHIWVAKCTRRDCQEVRVV